MDEVKPVACVPTVEHREPCESRGSRTVLGAPGGEIPPGDSTLIAPQDVYWAASGTAILPVDKLTVFSAVSVF